MARTLEEVTQSIKDTKAAQTSLNVLNSISLVAIWLLTVNMVAYAIWFHETLWDVFKAEVTAIANSQKAGTAAWYQQQMLLFQYGDDLTFVNNVPTYAVIDPTKQIVDKCAVTESDGIVYIKVATEIIPGSPQPLDSLQLTAFTQYVDDIKFAGTLITIINKEHDVIALEGTVFYNALGVLVDIQAAFATALDAYRVNTPFNGIVKLNSAIDSVQPVEFVNDFKITGATGTPDGGSPISFDRIYQTVSGYFTWDISSLTWTPSNV